MAIRQEAVVLGLTTALLGWWFYGDFTEGGALRVSRRTNPAPEFTDYPSPDVSLALPRAGERKVELPRDLFSPPRDTAPLPPLEFAEPPMEPLSALRPPFAFGPAAKAMGQVLGAPAVVTRVEGLFEGVAQPGEGELARSEWADDGDAAGADQERLQGLGYASAESDDALADLAAENPAERLAGYRRLYDSVLTPGLLWGRIRNENRWTLDQRPDEQILFEQINPETGQPLIPGAAPIAMDRSLVKEFHFAETDANRLELRLVTFGDPMRLSEVGAAVDFARECIQLRNEVPRALDIAEEMSRRALATSDGDDVDAALLLGEIQEARFDLEGAFQTYTSLVETHRTRADVHVRLADLLARLRLFGRAEQHFAEALNVSSTSWLAHWRFGRFLLSQGRGEEALGHLADAERREPSSPALRQARIGIRTDHGRCLLHVGRVDEALDAFGRALNGNPSHAPALAGVVACASFLGTADARAQSDAAMRALGDDLPEADFELSLALGLARTAEGEWEAAKSALLAAVEGDPFRAYQAYAGLSWLAERCAYPDEALGYANQAFQGYPNDPWVLYQRGRLLLEADDIDGAEENLRAALNLELNFVDALVAMAELQRATGEYLAAERYYERALEVDPARAALHSRRGFNLFSLGDSEAAAESFAEALRRSPRLASASLGAAWALYTAGDSQEAITRLGELVEARRNEPEGDPYRAWAQSQAERIVDHEEKEVWTDRFERRAGNIGNGWSVSEGFGPTVELRDGAVRIEGALTAKGNSRVLAELPTDVFLIFEAEVTIEASNNGVRAGLFISRERQGRDGIAQMQALVALARNVDGTVQAGLIRQGETEPQWQDLYAGAGDWVPGRPARLTIEKHGTGSDTTVNLFLDGVPLLTGEAMSRLGTATQTMRFGLFAEGDVGRRAQVSLDNVRVVRRIR